MYLKLQGTHLQAVFKYTSKFQINDAEFNTSKSTKTKQKQRKCPPCSLNYVHKKASKHITQII